LDEKLNQWIKKRHNSTKNLCPWQSPHLHAWLLLDELQEFGALRNGGVQDITLFLQTLQQ
jgi:hypothetical protein